MKLAAIRPQSLQAQISCLMVGLLIVAFVSVLAIVDRASQRIARQEVEQGLRTGLRVFLELLERNRRQLEQAATVLSADFGFREAVSSNDLGTVRSVLQNHGSRIQADAMMLASLDRQLVADTQQPKMRPHPFPFPGLIDEAERKGRASAIVAMQDGRLYQLVVVPVQAPATVAWVAMGFLINDNFAVELKAITGLHISFMGSDNDGNWRILASSLTNTLRAELPASIPKQIPAAEDTRSVSIGGQDYAAQLAALPTHSEYRVVSVLQQSLGEALEPFRRQQSTLHWVAAIATLLAIVAAFVMARTITRPINALARIAMRIREGDYSEAVAVSSTGEIGALAESIDLMRKGIEAREREILRLAYEDGLTGLPNRALFHDRLSNAIKVAKRINRPFSILMMDLDRFKYVNDTLGHHVGDQVLSEVGRRLREIVRESDTVARLGGDEFAVLLQNTNPDHLKATTQKILHALEKPIVHDGNTLDVGTSIGVANFSEHGDDPNLLMRRADMAMYVAKRTKSGYAIFDQCHDENRQVHLSMLSDLRHAVEHDQLRLYYQPKIDLKRRRVMGVEALLRWEHPVRGIVSPGDFIPFAEQTGFIRELTKWAIGRALRDSQAWAADGISLCISINVSARDLLSRDLADMLKNCLNAYGVPAQSICLEITESALMEDAKLAQKTLTELHDLGIKLSIDDYGTGYASLGYLKNFPVDEIKIDRVFVKNMATSRTDAAIVRSTIQLAHELGLVVVAEGVEEREDLELLASRDCDIVQGYLVSRPLPVHEFVHWWKQSEWGEQAGNAQIPKLHAA